MFRHKKRGTEYDLVGRARVQISSFPLALMEGDEVVVYKSRDDGRLWVRRHAEFYDGRFDTPDEPPIAAPQQPVSTFTNIADRVQEQELPEDENAPTARMVELRHCAVLLKFLLDEIGHPKPDFIDAAIENPYTTGARCEKMLYETLEWMAPELRYALLWHHDTREHKALALWWEKHIEMMNNIKTQNETIKKQALGKLTQEERVVLGF